MRRHLFRRRLTFGAQLGFRSLRAGGDVVERDDETPIGLHIVLELGRLDSIVGDRLVGRFRAGRVGLRRQVADIGRRGCRTGAGTRAGPEGFQQRRTGWRGLGRVVRDPVRPVAGGDVQIAEPPRKLEIRLVHSVVARRRLDERHVLRFHVVDGRSRHGRVEHSSTADRRSGGRRRRRPIAGHAAAERSESPSGRNGSGDGGRLSLLLFRLLDGPSVQFRHFLRLGRRTDNRLGRHFRRV